MTLSRKEQHVDWEKVVGFGKMIESDSSDFTGDNKIITLWKNLWGLEKFPTVDFLISSVIKRQQDRKHSGRCSCQVRSIYCRLSHYVQKCHADILIHYLWCILISETSG